MKTFTFKKKKIKGFGFLEEDMNEVNEQACFLQNMALDKAGNSMLRSRRSEKF